MKFWQKIPHPHKWQGRSSQGWTVTLGCWCGKTKEVTLDAEQQLIAEYLGERVSKDNTGNIASFYQAIHGQKTNWTKIEAAQEWVEKNSECADITWVDDDLHLTSALVTIRCGTGDNFRGTEVVFIPQCEDTEFHSFWLYPGANSNLIGALGKSRRAAFEANPYNRPIPRFDVVTAGGLSKRWYNKAFEEEVKS